MVFAFVPLHHLFPCASPSCIHLGRRLPSSLRIPQPARLALRNSAGLQIWQNHTGRRGYPKGAPSRITSESHQNHFPNLQRTWASLSANKADTAEHRLTESSNSSKAKLCESPELASSSTARKSGKEARSNGKIPGHGMAGWVDWKWLVAASAKLHGEYKNRAHSNAYPTRLPVLVAWVVLSSHWLARSLTLWYPAIRRPSGILTAQSPVKLSQQETSSPHTSWYQLLVGIL